MSLQDGFGSSTVRDTKAKALFHGDVERDSTHLDRITPRGLRHYLIDTDDRNQLDDGLLQRFSLLIYPGQRRWKHVDRVPNANASKLTSTC
jgi:hypothetical protein